MASPWGPLMGRSWLALWTAHARSTRAEGAFAAAPSTRARVLLSDAPDIVVAPSSTARCTAMPRSQPADRPAPSAPVSRAGAPRLLAVDRAIDDLRRRVPVIITDGERSHAVAAAELANDATLAWIGRLGAAAPALAITAHRARTLHIRPTGAEVVVIVGAQSLPEAMRQPGTMGLPAAAIATLVDPTADLAHPLRGPFEVAPGPPPVGFGAALVLSRLARLLPAAVVAPVDTGGDPTAFAARESLLCVTVEDIESYETEAATALIAVSDAHVPLAGAADARVVAFRPADGGIEHLAIVIGDPSRSAPVLVRLHSECFTGDLLASLRCDCGQQLRGAVEVIAAEGGGVLLYLAQEGRGIGLINKLRAYQLQDQGYDTIEANQRLGFEADERIFLPAAEMLRRLGFDRVRLLTNNPHKVTALQHHGIEVVERVAHSFPPTDHSVRYLETKATRSGHLL